MHIPEITPHQLQILLADTLPLVLLDVREPHEHAEGHLDGCILIPMGHLPDHFTQLDPKSRIVVYCRSGWRSAAATKFLISQGFQDVSNLAGGFIEWKKLG